jgi:hypothetical protein
MERPLGGDGPEFEMKYFDWQFHEEFIQAQENAIKINSDNPDTHPELGLFDFSAINYYTFHYSAFQKVLLKGSMDLLKNASHPFKVYFTGLTRALNMIPADTNEKKFNRFVTFDSDALDSYKEGSAHVWEAFSSFTTNDKLDGVSYNTKIEAVNDNESFKSIASLSQYPDQNEFLIAPPPKVKVLSKEKIDGMNIIKVEMI